MDLARVVRNTDPDLAAASSSAHSRGASRRASAPTPARKARRRKPYPQDDMSSSLPSTPPSSSASTSTPSPTPPTCPDPSIIPRSPGDISKSRKARMARKMRDVRIAERSLVEEQLLRNEMHMDGLEKRIDEVMHRFMARLQDGQSPPPQHHARHVAGRYPGSL